MEWVQLIEMFSSIALVVVTAGLLIATNMYRKATEQMAKIQQKSVEVQQEHVDLQEKNADDLKKDNAINLMYKWDDPALLDARRSTREITQEIPALSDEALLSKIEADEEVETDREQGQLKESLIHLFNYWGRVRLSIEANRADEDILKEAFSSIYLFMYERFEVWLDEQSPRYKEDLKKLYDRWKSTS